MSEDNQDLRRFANLRFSQLLSDGFRLFAKNWFKIVLPFALLLVISVIISNLLVVELNWQYYNMTPIVDAINQKDPMTITNADLNILVEYLVLTYVINLVTSVSGSIFTALAMSITGIQLYSYYTNNIGKEKFKVILDKKILIIILIFGIFVPLGTLLLFIPSIIILGYYVFIFFTYREKNVENPLKVARNLSRGTFWKIIGLFIISSIIISILNIFYQFIMGFFWNFNNSTIISWFDPTTRNYPMIILDDLIYFQFIGIIFSPLFICLLTPFYTSLKARKQLGFNYHKGSIAMQQSYTQISASSKIEEEEMSKTDSNQGFYCPFCGFYMSTKLKFCGNCGEPLEFEL